MTETDQSKYGQELDLALKAVQLCSRATKKMQEVIDKGTQTKSDDSPVTVADFAVQAMLISAIHHQFPEDMFIAEESSSMLHENQKLAESVMHLIESMDNDGDNAHHLTLPRSIAESIESIDRGSTTQQTDNSTQRIWILDPVDGTATFMTGQQYAVCLALIENGTQQVGVVGCPNIVYDEREPRVEESVVNNNNNNLDGGVILSAIAGQGAYVSALSTETFLQRKRLPRRSALSSINTARYVDSIKSTNIDHTVQKKIYDTIDVSTPPADLWSMQMKYAALALDSADATFRYPYKPDYRACVWDHAGGQLIFEESGGEVTDLKGRKYDYTQGRKFEKNFGLVAAVQPLQRQILEVVQRDFLN